MLKPAANITWLFNELPFLDRFEAAAEAGFEAVEILSPYDEPAPEIQRALIANDLRLVLINAPPPNYTGRERGWAALPGGEERFQYDMRRVMRYADLLNPSMIHVMSGVAQGCEAFDTFVRNLQRLADDVPHQAFTIEPLNPGDQPGYFLNDYDLAAEVLDAVDRPNIGLQFDSYHAYQIHGDALTVWHHHRSRVTHVQIGAPPDRTAPSAEGPVDFAALFSAMSDSGYDGWVSGEYDASGRTTSSLDWMSKLNNL